MPLQDTERRDHAAAQELVHLRLADLRQRFHEAQRRDVARQLVVVPQDPAQDLVALSLVRAAEFAELLREGVQDHARLAEALAGVLEHRHLAHRVDFRAVCRRAGLAVEEIDEARLPRRAAERERQRNLVGVAGLREAVEPVVGHLVIIARHERPGPADEKIEVRALVGLQHMVEIQPPVAP